MANEAKGDNEDVYDRHIYGHGDVRTSCCVVRRGTIGGRNVQL